MQGAGGGPNEDNVAGLLVRSTATNWTNGSILAVDPGRHLAAITKIIEEHLPQTILDFTERRTSSHAFLGQETYPDVAYHSNKESISSASGVGLNRKTDLPAKPPKVKRFLSSGPFASLELPYESAQANGAYIVRDLISTYLISHPHLDHVAGLVVNTASFQSTSRPKRLAALPSTIDAIRDHIFNEIIWPNLSDEDGGVGLVTYMRLVEARSNASGDRESASYIKICHGLSVKCWSVSHGDRMDGDIQHVSSRTGTEEFHLPHSSTGSESRTQTSKLRPRARQEDSRPPKRPKKCAYDSSAFFLRDDKTGKEVLIFGDVEPDSLSLSPRTARVWGHAAEKLVSGILRGVFIECSYDDSRSDATLFGHLCPRHLIFELQALAAQVKSLTEGHHHEPEDHQKRKRKDHDSISKVHHDPAGSSKTESSPQKSRRRIEGSSGEQLVSQSHVSSRSAHRDDKHRDKSEPAKRTKDRKPLDGLRIIIVHIKDTLQDGPDIGDTILAQLRHYEKGLQLGCDFIISKAGSSIWL